MREHPSQNLDLSLGYGYPPIPGIPMNRSLTDDVFGYENKIDSEFQKLKQDFNEKMNEHVIFESLVFIARHAALVPKPTRQPHPLP